MVLALKMEKDTMRPVLQGNPEELPMLPLSNVPPASAAPPQLPLLDGPPPPVLPRWPRALSWVPRGGNSVWPCRLPSQWPPSRCLSGKPKGPNMLTAKSPRVGNSVRPCRPPSQRPPSGCLSGRLKSPNKLTMMTPYSPATPSCTTSLSIQRIS